MTSKVHETHKMLLVFLDVKCRGSFTNKILSNENSCPLSQIIYIFNALNKFEVDRFFMDFSQMHILKYSTQIIVLHSLLRHILTLLS